MDSGDTLTNGLTEVNDFRNHGILAVSETCLQAESVAGSCPIVLMFLRILFCGYRGIENLASQFVVV